MNQTLTQIEKEFDEKFGNTPAIAGKITDSDECCNCGEDLALELYEAFSNGYEMAKDDIRPFLTQSNLRVIEKVKTRILSGMKPYTIKADKSVRVADLTTEQFESIVNSEEFWWEDESDLSTLIEQK